MGNRLLNIQSSDDMAALGENFIDDVPDEILENILSFIPVEELLNKCAVVNKRWNSIIRRRSLWRTIAHRHKYCVPREIEHSLYDLQRICARNPYDRNLLKNPNGNEQLSHWRMLQNGGDEWTVEKQAHYCDSFDAFGGDSCFATSFGLCSKEQVIDLEEEGVILKALDKYRFPIAVSEWFAARGDCGSKYELTVLLCDNSHKTLARADVAKVHTEQWQGGKWTKVSHVFHDYPPGVTHIIFIHSGVDDKFWKGHYGAKMAGGDVRILPTSQNSPHKN